jgi:transposase
MSLKPSELPPIPEQTQRVAKAAFKKNNLYIKMRDAFEVFLKDEQFADLFPRRGQPALAPWRLMLVTLFQFIENLSDRQAADAVRARIDWKYALSLDLEEEGFDASVLCEFRKRLVEQKAENRLFEAMLARFSEEGMLKVRGRQRTDSTHVLASVRAMTQVETIGETLRHALNVLAEEAPHWLVQNVQPDWFDRYSQRIELMKLPKEKKERENLILVMGSDGYHLLTAIWSSGMPELCRLPAVETLRQVWVQQFWWQDGYVGEEGLYEGVEACFGLRDGKDCPASELMIRSPYDVEARLSVKRETVWTGYKVHLTESCDEGNPHLICQVETTPSTMPDSSATPLIQANLSASNRLPGEQLVDEGYTQASHLVTSQQQYGTLLLGPVARDGSRQAVAGKGFDLTVFNVDWERQCATCPAGKESTLFRRVKNARGSWYFRAAFARSDCQSCHYRSDCTRCQTTGRTLYLHAQGEHEALHERRLYQKTKEFSERYKARSGIEGTLSESVRMHGLRRSRYVGQAKAHLQHLLVGAALNFCRVFSWLVGEPLATTRVSRFARLKSWELAAA